MSDCKDKIIAQYRNSPKIVQLIESFCNITDSELIEPINKLALMSVLPTAEGYWLDLIGERFNLKRPGVPADETDIFGFEGQDDAWGFGVGRFANFGEDTTYIPVDDDTYRRYIIARGSELLTDGSQSSLSHVATQAYDKAIYLDNLDMTVTIILTGITLEIANIASQIGLLPTPAAVGIKQIQVLHPEDSFGFDGQEESLGFDQAPFVGIVEVN